MSLRQIRRLRRTGWSLLVVAVLFAEPAPAMHPHIAFDELAQTADAIFVGEVVDQHSYWEAQGRTIFTDVTFRNVIPVHQGPHCAQDLKETVTLTFEGGQVGDIAISVSDSVTFAVGQKVVLFALMDGKVYANPLVGGPQGLFRVEPDPQTGREEVLTSGRSKVVGVEAGRLQTGSRLADDKRHPGLSALIAPAPKAISTGQRTPDQMRIESEYRAAAQERLARPAKEALTLEEFIQQIDGALAGPPPAAPVLGFFRNETPIVAPVMRDQPSGTTEPASEPVSQAELLFGPETSGNQVLNDAGQLLTVCGYQNLPIVMEQVSQHHVTYQPNILGMMRWSLYTHPNRTLFMYRESDGYFGYNWESEFAGFLSESEKQDIYGSGWGTAIGVCRLRMFPCMCCRIRESDIMFLKGLNWRYTLDETLKKSGFYLYHPVLLHELGHAWGFHTRDEQYNYDVPSVMHSYYSSIVEDGRDIHVIDAIALRQTYDNTRDVQNIRVDSYYASGGLHKAVTMKPGYVIATSFNAGDMLTISGFTVQNLSTVAIPNVQLTAYLCPERPPLQYDAPMGNWPANRQLENSLHWPELPKEVVWVGKSPSSHFITWIPDDVTPGTYYVGLQIEVMEGWDPSPFSYYPRTFLSDTVTIVCPAVAAPTGLTATRGTSLNHIELAWDGVEDWDVLEVRGKYEVWASDVPSPSTAEKLGEVSTPQYTHTPPLPGKDYYYWVKAVRACGTASGFSSGAFGYRGLDSPDVTGAISEDYLTIEVTWPAVEGATHYQVWRSDTYDLSDAFAVSGWLSSLSYSDPAPDFGKDYYYWVKPAVSDGGHNAPDLILERAGVGRLAYPPPTNVSATKGDTTHPAYVKITWDMEYDTWASPPDAIYYWIYRGDTNDPDDAEVIAGWITALEYNDYFIAEGPLCYYWVRARITRGPAEPFFTTYSEPDTGSRPTVPLNAPPNVHASVDTSTEHITITWGPVYGATHYRVWQGLFGATPVTGWITGTSYNYAAPAGCDYYFFVTAGADARGTQESPFGGDTGFHGPNRGRRAIAPPGSVSASDGTFTHKIRISWKEVKTCWDTHYKVYRHWHDDPAAATEISDWQLETAYDDTVDPIPGRNYWYWVRAASIGGSYPSGFSAAARGYRKLSRPQNVAATNGGSLSIVRISWASVGGASHYRVYRHTHNRVANATPITDWIGGTTTYDDDSAEVGQAYWYWVRAATSSAGVRESDLSESDRGYVRIPSPTGLTASQGTHADFVALGWNPVSSATHYRVYRSQTDNSKTAEPVSRWRDSTNYHDVSAAPAETYYYWVKAATDSDGDMESGFSQSVSGHRLLPPPLNVQASSGIYTRFVSVTWSPVQEATHYRVYRSDTPAPAAAQPITPWREHLSSYNDATPTPGRVYHYFVKAATDESGTIESPLSERDGGYIGLTSPTNVSATDGMYENRVFITWDEVPHATHYCVYRHTEPIPIEGTVISGWQTEDSFSDETADADTLYYYWVKASPSSDGRRPSRFSLYDTGWCGFEIQAGPDLLLLSQSGGARGRHD